MKESKIIILKFFKARAQIIPWSCMQTPVFGVLNMMQHTELVVSSGLRKGR